MWQEKELTSNFLPPRNLEIATNILSLFNKLFKPNWFNDMIRYVLVMKKSEIAISSIELIEFWIFVWQVCSIPFWMLICCDFFDDAREDTAIDWDSDTHNISSCTAHFFVPLFSFVSLYNFKYRVWNSEGILPLILL